MAKEIFTDQRQGVSEGTFFYLPCAGMWCRIWRTCRRWSRSGLPSSEAVSSWGTKSTSSPDCQWSGAYFNRHLTPSSSVYQLLYIHFRLTQRKSSNNKNILKLLLSLKGNLVNANFAGVRVASLLA